VGLDVAPRAAARVGAQQVLQAVAQQAEQAPVDRALQAGAIGREQAQQAGEVFGLPQAVHPGLAEADVAAREHLVEDGMVAHAQVGDERAMACAQAHAVGQLHRDRTAVEAVEHLQA